MQYEHISPQLVTKVDATAETIEIRQPMRDVQAWWISHTRKVVKTAVAFRADEWLKSAGSAIDIAVNPSTATEHVITARPEVLRPGELRVDYARPARHRTPMPAYQQINPHPSKPLTIWTWSHFPDAYNNTQIYKAGAEELTVMSEVELVTDFSHLVRATSGTQLRSTHSFWEPCVL